MTERIQTTIRRSLANREAISELQDKVLLLENAVKQLIIVGGQLPAGRDLGK